jgi:MFS transporter, UMF1 family
MPSTAATHPASGSPVTPSTPMDEESEQPETTEREVSSWVWLDWGHSVYSALAASGFLPLLIQSQGLTAAGFPAVCPNVVRDKEFLVQVFGNVSTPATAFVMADPLVGTCASSLPPCEGHYCRGLPSTTNECRNAAGTELAPLRAGGVDPTSMSTLFISLSVLAQAIILLTFGPVADFGTLRRRQLYLWTVVGGVASVLSALTFPDNWWLAGVLFLISNPAFGLVMVMANAYLPLLVTNLKEVKEAKADPSKTHEDVYSLVLKKSDEFSSRGFAWGYMGGVLSIIIIIPLTFVLDVVAVYQIAQAFAGIWWIVFVISCSYRSLPARPGPPLPSGSSWIGVSIRSTIEGFSILPRIPVTGIYLACWFLMSDGVFVIGSIGGLYANSYANWGCIPKGLGVAGLFLIVPLTAAIGGYTIQWCASRWKLRTKTTLLIITAVSLSIPIYGLLGYAIPTLGLRQGWEILMVGAVYGICLGPFQAYSRSLFSTLIPRGRETTLNSVYELTDKGSSFIGPAVMAALQAALNDLRPGMYYVLAMIVVPLIVIFFLDVDRGARDAAEFSRLEDDDKMMEMGSLTPASAAAVASASAREITEGHIASKAVAAVTHTG